MTDTRKHLGMFMGQRETSLAVLEVDAHRDHPGDAGFDCRTHHLVRIPELLEVEVRVYEDGASSSTTSSSRLKSACGGGRVRPGSRFDGRQRSAIS